MSNRHAFTLIELLIVVAIIAILAAIAVPNFLEAQTRSKISRSKADMRSIATALEAYYVDHNAYPYGDGQGDGVGSSTFPTSRSGLWRVTTPVAFMSSIPRDTFAPDAYIAPTPPAFLQPYTPQFFYVSSKPAGYPGLAARSLLATQQTYLYLVQDFRVNRLRPGFVPPPTTLVVPTGQIENVYWELKSAGADRSENFSLPYDPTNGTTSIGDIVLFGPGNPGLGF